MHTLILYYIHQSTLGIQIQDSIHQNFRSIQIQEEMMDIVNPQIYR